MTVIRCEEQLSDTKGEDFGIGGSRGVSVVAKVDPGHREISQRGEESKTDISSNSCQGLAL